ncbi:MAG: DUF3303 family protein [Candidatus Hermodarchaeia archaeon]|jgi:hypothetical protein
MLFVATLQHSPEDCFARPENAEAFDQAIKAWDEIEITAQSAGINLLGSYINPNEHVFFYIFDADNYLSVSRLLGSVMLTHHTAKITPVLTLREAVDAVKQQRAQEG